MKKLSVLLLLLFAISKGYTQTKNNDAIKLPAAMIGSFEDDYGIQYKINDTLWMQLPRTRFHIIKWDVAKKYIIARNDDHNPGEGGLYTRIDYMEFNNMA